MVVLKDFDERDFWQKLKSKDFQNQVLCIDCFFPIIIYVATESFILYGNNFLL